MAVVQVNGDAVTSNSTRNVGGTFLGAGGSPSQGNLNKLAIGGAVGAQTTRVIEGVSGVVRALGTGVGTFAVHGEWIARGLTNNIAGEATNVLRSGGSDFGNRQAGLYPIQSIRSQRYATALRGGHFNRFTGQFAEGYPATAVDTLATDNAANPTRAVPGRFVYLSGGKTVVNKTYGPRTG